jgi:hypothetical protein
VLITSGADQSTVCVDYTTVSDKTKQPDFTPDAMAMPINGVTKKQRGGRRSLPDSA